MMPYAESGKSFEFFSNVSLLTFDVILRCAFSFENDVQLRGWVQFCSLQQSTWTYGNQCAWRGHQRTCAVWANCHTTKEDEVPSMLHCDLTPGRISDQCLKTKHNDGLGSTWDILEARAQWAQWWPSSTAGCPTHRLLYCMKTTRRNNWLICWPVSVNICSAYHGSKSLSCEWVSCVCVCFSTVRTILTFKLFLLSVICGSDEYCKWRLFVTILAVDCALAPGFVWVGNTLFDSRPCLNYYKNFQFKTLGGRVTALKRWLIKFQIGYVARFLCSRKFEWNKNCSRHSQSCFRDVKFPSCPCAVAACHDFRTAFDSTCASRALLLRHTAAAI